MFKVIQLKKIFLILVVLLLIGCVQAKDFSYGIEQLNAINSKYNTTMETYPNTIKQIDLMLDDLEALKNLNLETGQAPLNYVVNYRILNLEAEKLYIQGQKYGNTGTTKYGFGCKPRPLILESVSLRNSSALKGFAAVDLLREFIKKYPKEAGLAGFSEKNALFLNATFYQIAKDARGDSNIINHFCTQNETLVLYKKEIKSKTNLSEDFINNLTYEKAVPIWKKIRGFS